MLTWPCMCMNLKSGRISAAFIDDLHTAHVREEIQMRHGKYQSRWFSYVNRFLWFPISFFYFHENWFQQIPRDYKIFTINGQHFFNPINGVPREIHKPPGNKEGTPLRHPLKKRTIFKRWTWHNFKLRRLWFSLRFMMVIIFRENTVGFLDRGNFMSWLPRR